MIDHGIFPRLLISVGGALVTWLLIAWAMTT